MSVDFRKVPFGYFRPDLARKSVSRSASARRGTGIVQRSNLTLQQQTTPESDENKNAFPALVLRTVQKGYAQDTDRVQMRSAETKAAEYKYYRYNVYYHGGSCYPGVENLQENKIGTYSTAVLDAGALDSMSALGNASNNFDLTDRLVTIEFEDQEKRLNPRIISVGAYADLDLYKSSLQSMMINNTVGGNGGPSPTADVDVGPGPGRDMSCPTVLREEEEEHAVGVTHLKGTDYQTGKKLHSNNWYSGHRANPLSTWWLPIKPGEGRAAATPTAIRASSGMNRGRNNSNHKAIDISAKTGTPLYAVQDAEVKSAPRSLCRAGIPSKCGNSLRYHTIDGYTVGICHLDMPAIVKKGDQIKKGQLLGHVGDTGSSTGAHLHWSVRKGGKILHPADFYPADWILLKNTTTGVGDTKRSSIPNKHTPVTV